MIDSGGLSSAGLAAGSGPRLVADNVADSGRLSDLLRLMGGGPTDAESVPDLPVPLRRLRSGETLFNQGGRADVIHLVRAGTFKTFRSAEDGYEQVLGFSSRAEVLGFDAICLGQHPTGCIALEDSSVYAVLVSDILGNGRRIPTLDRVLTLAVSRALKQQVDLADVMAAVAAEVRLARFILQLSQRMLECGQSPRRFYLRMGRREIASHLGVAHETVSRSFQALARWDVLGVSNREVEILDMEGLKALARNTRRKTDDNGGADGSLANVGDGMASRAAA